MKTATLLLSSCVALSACAPQDALPSLMSWKPPSTFDCADRPGTVEVEFSDRYQLVGLPIQVFTRSPAVHVDFVLCDGRLLGATPYGVAVRAYSPALWTRRYTFKADPNVVLGFAWSQMGKPYNWTGLISYPIHGSPLSIPGSWFCSQLVEAAAEAGSVKLSPQSARDTSPALLMRSPLLTRVGAT